MTAAAILFTIFLCLTIALALATILVYVYFQSLKNQVRHRHKDKRQAEQDGHYADADATELTQLDELDEELDEDYAREHGEGSPPFSTSYAGPGASEAASASAGEAWEASGDALRASAAARRVRPFDEAVRRQQLEAEQECYHLFRDLQHQQASVDSKLATLRQLRGLLEGLDTTFRVNKPALVTAQIMCCNVLMKMDGLDTLQGCKEDKRLEEHAQWIIEKVVPIIWSN
ncbi:unnamed protein product [Vitrella brassicaformis CCMP3155]|uniref:Uncharacterized protein n=2 Tax=Vitrella brassicaformis TaxID=1169539 RepID=A0A0G4E918_VITBC|nr:unnamed protein product [Vitrella brassicaformis CCMP3155]|eukprot:CEL91700.1 unnamed protein product [Vitrella brassicaformis CCMP3155]